MTTFLEVAGLTLVLALPATRAGAHCDTLDGPVVKDARLALEKGTVTPVLKWIQPVREAEVREAFTRALAVRKLGPEAMALADRSFFETLVRVHREGEGAPYTGLKPKGEAVEPGIAATDRALDQGSVDALTEMVTSEVARGLKERFARAAAARTHAEASVEQGREYVAAYVELMHYAERLHQDATTPAAHAEHGVPAPHRH